MLLDVLSQKNDKSFMTNGTSSIILLFTILCHRWYKEVFYILIFYSHALGYYEAKNYLLFE